MRPSERPFPLELRPITRSGANKAAEATDPYIATVMAMPTPGYDGVAAMARTFVEEFALMGWPRERIARLFRIPRYAAAYAVLQTRGPEYVTLLIEDVLGPDLGGTSSGGGQDG